MGTLKPDSVVEEEFIDQWLDENLDVSDQEYLMDALGRDEVLSSIVDKMLIRAIEVSHEGEIEGPGTGTSDSIPARLSDGEFVFSAEAVEVIGVENLERMMAEDEPRSGHTSLLG